MFAVAQGGLHLEGEDQSDCRGESEEGVECVGEGGVDEAVEDVCGSDQVLEFPLRAEGVFGDRLDRDDGLLAVAGLGRFLSGRVVPNLPVEGLGVVEPRSFDCADRELVLALRGFGSFVVG